MERIRVDPGYYPDRFDYRFRDEIVKYFNEVGPSQSSFPKARQDYFGSALSDWLTLYALASYLTYVA